MRTLAELSRMAGRRVLLAGGAGHLALAAAEGLVELGAIVAIVDRDASSCQARADHLNQLRPGAAFAEACDLSDEQATRAGVRRAIAGLGGLDVIVDTAAYAAPPTETGWMAPFGDQSLTAFDAALRVNVTKAFVLVQEGAGALKASGRGAVVLFSSIYGMVGPDHRLYEGLPMGNAAGYAASKGGLLQLVRYLATTLAPHVRVNAISPGGVWRSQPDAFHQRYVSRTPLGRMAIEEDVKGAVAFLASDQSAYVTGHNLVVDGGWTTW